MNTITDCILNFRDGLRSLLPVMDRAHIPWKKGEAYDDWDEIAACLFKSLVERIIQYGLSPPKFENLNIAAYDTLYKDYRGLGFIEVVRNRNATEDERLVFVSFSTTVEPFDSIEVCKIDSAQNRLRDDFDSIRISDVGFRFSYHDSSGIFRSLSSVSL